MSHIITLDPEGKQLFKDVFPRGKKPLNGFEKGLDGNFYKQLRDPRCISYFEKLEEIENKRKEEAKRKDGKQSKCINLLPIAKEKPSTIYIHTDEKITIDFIRGAASNYGGFAKINGNLTIHNVRLKEPIPCPIISKFLEFAKIEFNVYKGCVFFWIRNSLDKYADYAVEIPW